MGNRKRERDGRKTVKMDNGKNKFQKTKTESRKGKEEGSRRDRKIYPAGDGVSLVHNKNAGKKNNPEPENPLDCQLPDTLKKRKVPHYTYIKRNVYLSKKKRVKDDAAECSCKPSSSGLAEVCDENCHCRMTNVICSSSCHCGKSCVNKPFLLRKAKRLKLSKTEKCGWGVKAHEDIMAGEFVIEYVGEVIDVRTCGERLCKMKEKGETNFYLVQMNSETFIDATYKGNKSRFINHSCLPNTVLQKWKKDWETRAAVFATKNIKKGEFITYDYQWIQFGNTDQPCYCGEPNCKLFLGANHGKHNSLDEATKVVIQEVILPRALKVSHPSADINPKDGPHEASGKEILLFRKKTPTAKCIGLPVRVWSPLDQRLCMIMVPKRQLIWKRRHGILTSLFLQLRENNLPLRDLCIHLSKISGQYLFHCANICLYFLQSGFLTRTFCAATVDSQWQHCDGNTESVYLGKDQGPLL